MDFWDAANHWDHNSQYRLKDIAVIGMAPSLRSPDFFLQRRGSPHRVGRPHLDYHKYDLAVRIKPQARKRFTPTWVYWNLHFIWREGYWKVRSYGTLPMQHIRKEDVKRTPLELFVFVPLGIMDSPQPADRSLNPMSPLEAMHHVGIADADMNSALDHYGTARLALTKGSPTKAGMEYLEALVHSRAAQSRYRGTEHMADRPQEQELAWKKHLDAARFSEDLVRKLEEIVRSKTRRQNPISNREFVTLGLEGSSMLKHALDLEDGDNLPPAISQAAGALGMVDFLEDEIQKIAPGKRGGLTLGPARRKAAWSLARLKGRFRPDWEVVK
jgi:hypothetical protein